MSRFPCTRAECVRICQDGPGDRDRSRALTLLKRLRDSEAALARDDERAPAMLALLRGLVLAARELAGTGWLIARASRSEVAAFLALDVMPQPPAPTDLDQVMAGLLQARFPVKNGSSLPTHDQRWPDRSAALATTPPRNQSLDPGTRAKALASIPPVRDSATASVKPPCFSAAPTRSASL